MKEQKLNFKGSYSIFTMDFNNNETVNIATFGNYTHEDLLAISLDISDCVKNIVLINANEVYDGKPNLKTNEIMVKKSLGPYVFVPENEDGEPEIISNFETYLSNDNISFVFNPTNDEGVINYDYEDGRVYYGYDDDYNLIYLSINNLTKEEHDKLVEKFTKRNIPIVKKNNKITKSKVI